VRLSKLISVAVLALVAGAAAFAEAPKRVVSMNVCTDQLAMLLASEGQLQSLSPLATDPRISGMANAARTYHINSARAEEVYLMQPDLVLAGTYTARASVDMLERLGLKVIRFAPVNSLADVPVRLTEMGAALGREARAAELVAEFKDGLAALEPAADIQRPRAIQYGANGYTQGENTLSDEMIEAAGFINIASEKGISFGANMPLEVLAMSAPDLVITSKLYPGTSRAEGTAQHPVVAAVAGPHAPVQLTSRDWICGTPFVLRAIKELAQHREAFTHP
jgi:iron complex transport system substrate-binding protein